MRLLKFAILPVLLGSLLAGCQQAPSQSQAPVAETVKPQATADAPKDPEVEKMIETANALFKPLPEYMGKEVAGSEMIDLGRMLYYEKRLSKDGSISCNSCHNLQTYGVDGEPTSLGVGGQRGGRNSPTVYNAALHIAQFWDGRSPHVEDQASGPMLNPVEMAMDTTQVEERLKAIPGYRKLFASAFPDSENPVTIDNAAKAIAAFERGLVTPGAFDKFLAGDAGALTHDQLDGYKLFVDVGCASCHNGAALGGGQYQKLGVKKPYETADLGRYEVTHKEQDKMKFKVPGLRNIAETGPYFHDGSVKTLPEGISLMAEHQLGKTLTNEEVVKIEAFLKSLTGEIDQKYVAEPELPPGEVSLQQRGES